MLFTTTTEERTAKLEGLLEQMDKRLTNIEGEIVRTHNKIERLDTKIDQKFNWQMGIMITMWVSLIITTLFK